MKTIRGLIPLFRLHKWGGPTIVLLGLLMSLTEGVGIGLFIPLLNPDRRFAIILTRFRMQAVR